MIKTAKACRVRQLTAANVEHVCKLDSGEPTAVICATATLVVRPVEIWAAEATCCAATLSVRGSMPPVCRLETDWQVCTLQTDDLETAASQEYGWRSLQARIAN